MNVLSLFDGMSCGQIALKELDIPVNNYYASEIDKFAIKQTQHNFKNTIQLGNIENWKNWDIDFASINLILTGSPCQGFSFAGKGLNFEDPRSKLFFVFVEILNHVKSLNPDVFFLLENVNMKKNHNAVISELLGVFPARINSNLVSAQNRDRLYWSNIQIKSVGLFGEKYTDIPQPEDRGIMLVDILQPEEEVDLKYYLSQAAIDRMIRKTYSQPKINPDKTGTLNTKNNSGQCSFDSGTTIIQKGFLRENDKIRPIEKANCIGANYYKGLDQHGSRAGVMCSRIVNRKLDENGIRKDNDSGIEKTEMVEPGTDGKSGTLTTVQKDNTLLIEKNRSRCINGDENGLPSQGDRIWDVEVKNPAMTASKACQTNIYKDFILRRLTPTECARLQTIPDWYIWVCSDTQIYKMLGNGWTIEVIKHILKPLKK